MNARIASNLSLLALAVLPAFTFAAPKAEAAGAACSVRLSNNGWLAQVEMPARTVTLLGWQHLGSKALLELSKAGTEAYKATDCGQVSSLLSAARSQFPKDVSEANRVFAALSSLDQASGVKTIGVEVSAAEFPRMNKIDQTFAIAFERIAQRCPETEAAVKEYQTLFPGPVAKFAQSKPTVKLDAYEDDALKLASGESAIAMSKIQFFDGDLPPAVVGFLRTLKPVAVDPALEAQMSSRIETAEAKAKFSEFVAAHNGIFSRIGARNTAIAHHIAEQTQGDYVAVIGALHVPELAAELQALCKSGAR